MGKGYIHIYTGDGKGKTTAAAGLSTRAVGQNKKVAFFQFLKSGFSGEMASLARLGVSVFAPQGNGKFVKDMSAEEKIACQNQQQASLERAVAMGNDLDLLVLDEVICAVETGIVPLQTVLMFMENKPDSLELVLTGRNATAEMIERADYVSELVCVKHPYEKGITARKGIEF